METAQYGSHIFALVEWCKDNVLWLNSIAHICIFTGFFYLNFYARQIPWYKLKPLWFAGCSSAICFITILIQAALGSGFPLSYTQIGVLCETLLNFWLAVSAVQYIYFDIKQSK